MSIQLHFTILSISLLFYFTSSTFFCNPSTELWCNETQMSMQFALQQAIQIRNQALLIQMENKSRNKEEKAVLADCVELYEHTIIRLNYTLAYKKAALADAQTWLTEALTNLETCRIGFTELSVAAEDIIPLLMSHNVSKLISSAFTLINKSLQPEYEESVLSGWVPTTDDQLVLLPRNADFVVAEDGSGDFKTIQEAVDFASKRKKRSDKRFVIYVKEGVYKENVEIGHKGNNITMVGDGIGKTIVTGNRSVKGCSTTFRSATFAITGDGFIGGGMTFRNTAGPSNGQAVALRSGSDRSVFYRCSFEGYQDTLYVYSNRQFYRECDIYGTTDFIFGNAVVVFQNCSIYSRSSDHKTNTITAQSRSDMNQNSGIVIQNSRVMAADPKQIPVKTFLGRPWGNCSRTVFLTSFLDSLIDPAGWMDWSNRSMLNTLYYGEYENRGPGSLSANRVKWVGYHLIRNQEKALIFTVKNFISGDSWLPSSGVPFSSGL